MIIFILDSATYYQFAKYFEAKGVNSDVEDTNQTRAFLHDFYPGMKEMPNKLVQLMASPHPEKTINIKANIEVVTDSEDEHAGNAYSAIQQRENFIQIGVAIL